jgi:hypothetical protein
MSESALALDRQSVDLLLSVMETPNAMIAGAVLSDYYEQHADQLMAANLLERCGHELVTTSMADHDDAPVSLTWSAEHNGYGYFSPSAGWITVPDERLVVFGINVPVMLARMMVKMDLLSRAGPAALTPNLIWEIGDVRFGSRRQSVPIWFARRLHEPSVWRQLRDAVRLRPAPRMRVVLTSTPSQRWPEARLPGHELIDVRNILDHDLGLAIDPGILAARIDGEHRGEDEPLWHSADFGLIRVNGSDYRFVGAKHRRIIRRLVEAYQAGSPICLTAAVLAEAECGDSVNTLAKAFSGRQDWRDFIKEEAGNCWIVV